MSTRGLAWVLLLAVPAFLVGCLPSDNPLSGEEDSKVDEALLGEWRMEKESMPIIVRRSERFRNALEIPELLEDIPAYTLEIDGKRYVSYRDRESRGGAFSLARYTVSPDGKTVKLVFLNETAVEKAIDDGRVAGNVKIVKHAGFFGLFASTSKSVRLTDTSDNLKTWLAKHGDECFQDPKGDHTFTFLRVRKG